MPIAPLSTVNQNRTLMGAGRAGMHAFLALVVVMSVLVASGCGKPAYCSDVSNLENSVKSLPSAATSGGVKGLESQITTIKSQANTVESSAKSDFPTETSALTSAIDQLQSSVTALPAKPSTSQLAAIAINATAVVNAVQSFTSATNSKCK
jgi:hypothetical protein